MTPHKPATPSAPPEHVQAAATRIQDELVAADAGRYSGAWYFYVNRRDVQALISHVLPPPTTGGVRK